MDSIFNTLYGVNVNDNVEKKNGLSYLSWAWAWAEIKKVCPDAQYTIYERETEYGPVNYFTDGKTCWVKTGVTLNGLEHIEELPVMDFKNKSISLSAVTSMDVNKTIQRSLTKACARHGLGLYIYAGEDLPEEEKDAMLQEVRERRATKASKPADAAPKQEPQQTAKTAESGNSGGFSAATSAQIDYIKNNASDEDYMSIMQEFGANLEALSESDAKRVIAEIDRNNTDHPRCVKCGKVITGIALKNGTTMTAGEIVKKSQETYNGTYCLDCMTALKKKKSGAA